MGLMPAESIASYALRDDGPIEPVDRVNPPLAPAERRSSTASQDTASPARSARARARGQLDLLRRAAAAARPGHGWERYNQLLAL